jgi:superfamily II DNA or RNA helicase
MREYNTPEPKFKLGQTVWLISDALEVYEDRISHIIKGYYTSSLSYWKYYTKNQTSDYAEEEEYFKAFNTELEARLKLKEEIQEIAMENEAKIKSLEELYLKSKEEK